MGVEFGNQPCLDPRLIWETARLHGWPTDWLGKPNAFTCPLGSNPGHGWLLMARQHLNALDLNGLHDLAFTTTNIVPAGSIQTTTLKQLVIVSARCITPGVADDSDSAYLVEIADRRHLWAGIPIDKAYNVRGSGATNEAYFDETFNPDTNAPWEWEEMLEDIWNEIGKLGEYPGLPFTPDGRPEGFSFWGQSAWAALDTALRRLETALKYDPVEGTFAIVNVGDVDSEDAAETERAEQTHRSKAAWEEYALHPVRGLIPAIARVHFRKYPVPAPDRSPFEFVDVNDPEPGMGQETGSYVNLYDDLHAKYMGEVLQNEAALTARAQERARDFFRRLHDNERMARAYAGAVESEGLRPGSRIIGTAWHDRGTGMKTEVMRDPGLPTVVVPPDPWTKIEIVRLVSETTNEAGYYDAYIQQYDPDTNKLVDARRIWLLDMNDPRFHP